MEFTRTAGDEGFPWFALLPDLVEAYKQHGEDLYYRYDGHLTRAGNRVVADSVSDIFLNILGSRKKSDSPASP